MACTVSAYGAACDLDDFLRTSTLEGDRVRRKGEWAEKVGIVAKSCGLSIETLDNELDNLDGQ
jgi:hypothetical protein